ncbi:YdbH domain-containing protein [Litorimonas sp. RW-G-Af-16]|uniref:intermembrane phospholipid transport protein YdbH family protein n=1 Tax=Litorimonas sp. RW-G-Af-16 TaxID=3241168 RepID=UPI00390CAD22
MTAVETISPPPIKADRKRRPWWVWLLWAVLFVLLIAAMALYWAWSNRMGLLEQLAIDTLAEDGITAELSIQDIDKTHIILNKVKLSYEDERFFAADKIRADYEWRDALEGRFKRLAFTKPSATVTLDAQGKIIDGWVPPGMGQTDEGGFPPEGVTVTDGLFTLRTPYGTADVRADAKISDTQNFTADLTLPETKLTLKDGIATVRAAIDIVREDGLIKTQGSANLPLLDHPAFDGTEVQITFDGYPDIAEGQRAFRGDINATFETLNTAQVALKTGQMDWRGDVELTDALPDLRGTWRADVASLRLPDPIRTRDLARTLSLSPALSTTPIAENFVGDLERKLLALLTESRVSAAGDIQRDAGGAEVTLSEPLIVTSDATTLTLRPAAAALPVPTYQFDRAKQVLLARFDVQMTQPVDLSATGVEFAAQSINGWQIDQVNQFKARIKTQSTWQNKRVPARLRPFSAMVEYDGTNLARRTVGLNGKINYDGPIPGAIVEALKTGGRMDVILRPNTMALNFMPADGGRVSAAKIATQTDWLASKVTATLAPAAPLYTRTGDTAKINAILSDVILSADRLTEPARLEVSAAKTNISGALKTVGGALQQDWSGTYANALITSEDLPGPNTRIALGDGAFTTQLTTGQTPEFTLTAPLADVQSDLVQAKAISLDVAGTPNDYRLTHEGGRVKLTGNDLPPMPIKGRVNFVNGQYEGEAIAFLPQANDTPIDIDYTIRDSQGTAVVTIDALQFKPGKLQPQALIPTLRGKIARVEGQASAKINLAFGANQPLQSSGTAKLINMNIGTAPGPLTNVNTELDLASVLPLKTRGRQTLTVEKFDPGLPLENGVIEYEFVEDGVKVYSARWPLGDGFFSLDPFTWKYAATENRVVLRLDKVGLGEFLNNLGDGAIEATGDLEGTFPIVISGIDVRVDGGRLFVKDGGVIKYTAKEAAAAGQANEYAGKALEALKDFRYRELSAEVNGPLDGDVKVGLAFDGKNPDVLNGQPFAFDVGIEGELFNILRSFNTSAQIKAQLADQGISVKTE